MVVCLCLVCDGWCLWFEVFLVIFGGYDIVYVYGLLLCELVWYLCIMLDGLVVCDDGYLEKVFVVECIVVDVGVCIDILVEFGFGYFLLECSMFMLLLGEL